MSLVVVSHDNTKSLEFLQSVSDDLTGSGGVVVLSSSVVLASSVDVSESANSNLRAEVDLSGQRCNSDVVPVRVFRSQVLQVTSLDEIVVLRLVFGLGTLGRFSLLAFLR